MHDSGEKSTLAAPLLEKAKQQYCKTGVDVEPSGQEKEGGGHDFCWGGGVARGRAPSSHASVGHTSEAVACSWGSVSDPAVNRIRAK